MSSTWTQRAEAGLLGVAIGDALGATVEFMTPAAIQAAHGTHDRIVGGGAFGWRPGQGTDDTDLTWAVAAAYLDGFTIARVADNMLAWYSTGPRDVGATTAAALSAYGRHGDPTRSGRTHDRSAGNGSLMRALPTAITQPDPERRAAHAAAISAVTHAEPRCVDACIAYTDIAAALLAGREPHDAIATAAARPELHHEVADALAQPADTSAADLDTSGYVVSSLRCAVWAIRQPEPAPDVLVDLVNRGDDADTTGAIAGGLLGLAMATSDRWPHEWTDPLEYRNRLVTAAPQLVALRTANSPDRS